MEVSLTKSPNSGILNKRVYVPSIISHQADNENMSNDAVCIMFRTVMFLIYLEIFTVAHL